MKKIWIVFVLFLTTACSSGGAEEINGQTPDQVAVQWVIAKLQNDNSKQAELLTAQERSKHQDYFNEEIKKGEKNDWQLDSNYRLTEWQPDENTFYYLAEYMHPMVGSDKVKVKVLKTQEGWKVADFLYPKDFEARTQSVEPEIIKEANE